MGFPGNQVGLVLAAACTRTLLAACGMEEMGWVNRTGATAAASARTRIATNSYLGAHRGDTATESGLLAHCGLGAQSHFASLWADSGLLPALQQPPAPGRLDALWICRTRFYPRVFNRSGFSSFFVGEGNC